MRQLAPLLLAAQLVVPPSLSAQRLRFDVFSSLGGESDERWRLDQLQWGGQSDGVLLRSVSRRAAQRVDTAGRFRLLLPELRFIRNSALPYSSNDGSLRPGRGVSVALAGGVDVRWRSMRLLFAPEMLAEENRPYQVLPYSRDARPSRSEWSNPFHPPPESIDLPLRYGDRARQQLNPGQSTLSYRAGPLEVGASTENLWWGPGIRTAIILSNNASGFPHLLLRPAQPMRLGAGRIDVDLVLGRLSESEFFDDDPTNDHPSLAAGAVTWRADTAAGLQIGISRLRIAGPSGHDQMSSLFGRWLFPDAGFEAYAEWARFQDPASIRDLLEFPTHEQGYTFGLQWARPVTSHRAFRLQAEVSYLEPSASFRIRPVTTSYTSNEVPQGFTNAGKVLGAGIGPGSSAQWIAADLFGASWHGGVFASRVRYDNGTLLGPLVPDVRDPDVTLVQGIRLTRDFRARRITLQYSDGTRLNYLFQGGFLPAVGATGGFRGIDISNRTLSVTLASNVGR